MSKNLSYQRNYWFVVYTHARREDFVAENLTRENFNIYCPKIVKRIRHARREYDSFRPLFPGYIFIDQRSSSSRLRKIIGTHGVRSIVSNGDRPSLLSGEFIDLLKAREIDGVIQKPPEAFLEGQHVSVSGGPFDGIIGQIIKIRDNDRILLLLNLLNQQTKVHVDGKMLRST